jgi:hypothetical protein
VGRLGQHKTQASAVTRLLSHQGKDFLVAAEPAALFRELHQRLRKRFLAEDLLEIIILITLLMNGYLLNSQK